MKIQRAIEVLQHYIEHGYLPEGSETREAISFSLRLIRYIQNHVLNLRDFLAYLAALEK